MDWFKQLPDHALVGVGVVLLVLVTVILSKRLYEKEERTHPDLVKKGASLVKRAADDTFEAQEVINPLLSLSKANYALAYLDVARQLAPDTELFAQSKIVLDQLREDAQRAERRARDRVLKQCPELQATTRAGAQAGYHKPRRAPRRTASTASMTSMTGAERLQTSVADSQFHTFQ